MLPCFWGRIDPWYLTGPLLGWVVSNLRNTYSKHPHMETCWVICCYHATSDLDGFLQILQEDSTDCFWGALEKFYAAILKNTVTGFYLRWDMVWCRAPSCVLKCCLLGNKASKGCQGNSSMLYATVRNPWVLSSCMCKNRLGHVSSVKYFLIYKSKRGCVVVPHHPVSWNHEWQVTAHLTRIRQVSELLLCEKAGCALSWREPVSSFRF